MKAGIEVLKMLSATTVTKDINGLLEPGNLMSTSIYPSMLSGLVDADVTVRLPSNNSLRCCKGIAEQKFRYNTFDMQDNGSIV